MIDFYLHGLKKTISVSKKIFFVIFVYLAVISLFFYLFNKDKIKINQNLKEKNRQEIYSFIHNDELNKTKEGKLTIAFYKTLMCGMVGEACTDNPTDGDKNFKNSAVGFISNLIVFPYANPPASGIFWVSDTLKNAGLIPKTYAAEGIGLAAIMPLMSIWKAFRDISYMLLVLVLITIGFLIMFRTKINPQTVITVENALPKIVIAMIFITFSFPIAGFLIDLMYVLIIIVIQILSPQLIETKVINNTQELVSQYLNPSFGKIFPPNFFKNYLPIGIDMYNILPEGIKLILTPIMQFIAGMIAGGIAKSMMSTNEGIIKSLVKSFNNIAGGTFSWGELPRLIGVILDILIFLFLAIFGMPLLLGILVFFTLIFVIFRIFFALLFDYVSIILLIIFSPIILIFEALPGKNTFSFWIKNLMANLLGFVAVITLILISSLIGATFNSLSKNSTVWAPPFIFGINADSLSGLIGLGIFLLIPDLLKMIKGAVGAKGLPINLGLGTFFGGVGAAYGGAMGSLQQFSGLAQFPGVSTVIGKVPGLGWLKEKIIPPTQLEVQRWATIEQLKAMQSTVTGNQAEKIKEQIDKISSTLPKQLKG